SFCSGTNQDWRLRFNENQSFVPSTCSVFASRKEPSNGHGGGDGVERSAQSNQSKCGGRVGSARLFEAQSEERAHALEETNPAYRREHSSVRVSQSGHRGRQECRARWSWTAGGGAARRLA